MWSRACRQLPRPTCRRDWSEWLDRLDENGRWALLKLITGALRIGVSARLARTALARLGGSEADEIEDVWHADAAALSGAVCLA